MGYTHYFSQSKAATQEQWDAICTDFKRIIAAGKDGKSLNIRNEWDDPYPPEITLDHIKFNGVQNEGHETMFVFKNSRGFSFCKTAKKNYDVVVVALLLIMYRHAPEVWSVTSDGDKADWSPALNWLNSLDMGEYNLPPSIS